MTRTKVLLALVTGYSFSGIFLSAADVTTPPTFVYRRVDRVPEVKSELTTASCHYRPIFSRKGPEGRVMRSLERFAIVEVDAGGHCASTVYEREEQIYVVLKGKGQLDYGGQKYTIGSYDFMYLPPSIPHSISNTGSATLKFLVLGYRIPRGVVIHRPSNLQIANIQDVPLKVLSNHPPSVRYRLLMGLRSSQRDRIAAAHVLTSLFFMEFEPGGTNQPHHHEREEELYYVLSGEGEMVAGGGVDGTENRRPARAGDAYFFRLNCTVGF